MGFDVNNNISQNKLNVGKTKLNKSINLNKLTGISVNDYNSLFNYIEKTQNIKIDKDGNSLIEGDEVAILQNALQSLAGENGIIDKKDFKQLKNLDRDTRKHILYLSEQLAEESSNSEIIMKENGDYQKFYGKNNLKSGKENGVSYTIVKGFLGRYDKQYEDGSILSYDNKGNEISGKSVTGEEFTTSYIDNLKVRTYSNGLNIFYDKDKEVYRKDQLGGKYIYKENNDGSYEKTFIDEKITNIYDAEDKLIGGSGEDKSGKYTFTVEENGFRTRKYESGSIRYFDVNNKFVGGINPENREYTVTYSTVYDRRLFTTINQREIRYKDNNELYIIDDDEKVLEHKTDKLHTVYSYGSDGSYTAETFTLDGSKLTTQMFDSKGRLTRNIDYSKKDENYTVSYTENGDQIYNYSNGEVYVYNKDDRLLKSNGQEKVMDSYDNNGKLDDKFQQGDTGNCWLISGLTSIMVKPGGKEFLEKQITYSKQNNSYTVTLPGVNRKYTITQDKVDSAEYLSVGDKDIRLFEIAMDEYLKETNKIDLDEHGTALDGNSTETLYDALYGNAKGKTIHIEDGNIDFDIFNNTQNAYTIAHTKDSMRINGISSDGNEYPLINNHGYSVVKSDAQYVYLLNPNGAFDPQNPEENMIKVKIHDFKAWCNVLMKTTLTKNV